MSKKHVSRRSFLKNILQVAGAAGTATVLNFFPEAKIALADTRVVQADVWSLSSAYAEKLMAQSLKDAEGVALRDYLAKSGFVEVPNIYFAQRARVISEDKSGKSYKHQTDVLVVGYLKDTQENKGAMILFVADNGSTPAQWQVSMAVIQDDALYYIQSGKVAVHEDKDSPLITAAWFSEFVQGVSPVQGKMPLVSHGPCSNAVNDCLVLSSSCAALGICCAVATPCCVATIGACAASATACAIAANCCNQNPGTHNC